MDEDRVELLRRLFVVMTELAEDACDIAVQGQGQFEKLEGYADAALSIRAKTEDLSILAQSAVALARPT